MLVGMVQGSELMERVRSAQEELGSGDAADALAMVEPLLSETSEALRSPDFLAAPPHTRRQLIEAFCYARVTAVLALEAAEASEAIPRIRSLAAEALEVATGDNPAWKVLCAAAEMFARAGDADSAVWAVRAAERLAPQEEYVVRVRGSLQSMFPAAFTTEGRGQS
jgi:hypothetical protein